MTALVPGGNAPVVTGPVQVEVKYSPIPGADIDVSAFVLNATGKVRDDGDMCFYGQTTVQAGAVQMSNAVPGQAVFHLDLSKLATEVEKVALTATIYENKANFDRVSQLALTVGGEIEAQIPTKGMNETALILGEFYRRQGAWKFRCIAQGFAGGLEPLAKHFGVMIKAEAPPAAPASQAAPPPTPSAPPPAAPAKINLSKITLDKSRSSIDLKKTSAGFGEIRVNLNWHRGSGGGGFFSRNKAIDLDVGCLYELRDGSKGAVQALGNAFGDLHMPPFIQLMGDDRTGAVTDGEWLHINGKQWGEVRRVLVYAFIYDGAPNWKSTDGVVTIYIPSQPDIEVQMNEEGGSMRMCAIALLENNNGAIKVSRRVDFFKDHRFMDEAYSWGMRWTAGSK